MLDYLSQYRQKLRTPEQAIQVTSTSQLFLKSNNMCPYGIQRQNLNPLIRSAQNLLL